MLPPFHRNPKAIKYQVVEFALNFGRLDRWWGNENSVCYQNEREKQVVVFLFSLVTDFINDGYG